MNALERPGRVTKDFPQGLKEFYKDLDFVDEIRRVGTEVVLVYMKDGVRHLWFWDRFKPQDKAGWTVGQI